MSFRIRYLAACALTLTGAFGALSLSEAGAGGRGHDDHGSYGDVTECKGYGCQPVEEETTTTMPEEETTTTTEPCVPDTIPEETTPTTEPVVLTPATTPSPTPMPAPVVAPVLVPAPAAPVAVGISAVAVERPALISATDDQAAVSATASTLPLTGGAHVALALFGLAVVLCGAVLVSTPRLLRLRSHR